MTSKGLGFLPAAGLVVALALAMTACEGDRASQQGPNPGEDDEADEMPQEEEREPEEIANLQAVLGQEEGSELFDEDAVGQEPAAQLRITDEGADVTSYDLEVTGFEESAFYLATVHVQECGSDPEASGDLYEGDEDTEEAPEGEIDEGSVMIQVATDAEGNGSGQLQLDDEPDEDEMGSLLVSTDPTDGAEEPAPQDGDPVACMNLDL